MANSIEYIYEEIRNKNVGYNEIRREIKIELISHIKSNVTPIDFVDKTIDSITSNILSLNPAVGKIFNGNVDAKKIKEIATKYGFSHETDGEKTNGGSKLLTVKTERNALAHGNKSFKECGKEYTFEDIKDIKEKTIAYLEAITNNIVDFLENEKYRK